MSNGPTNPMVAAATDFLSKNVTKLGMTGATLYVLSQLALAIIHRSAEAALQAVGYAGLLLIGWGAAIRSKRATDMIATTQAENKIENPGLTPKSSDPAVQRAIEKIQRDSR